MTHGIEADIEVAIQRANADAWNCIAVVLADRALEQARALDREMAGSRSAPPLAGVPFVVKSLFDVKGEPREVPQTRRFQSPRQTPRSCVSCRRPVRF
jgi:Asp-tRNA(Asn)/Glu-tRNA(Gln) amidotransferase A subunit family amidase